MAEGTVIDRADAYTSDDAQQGVQQVGQAIAILHTVRVAVEAVEDGSMAYDNMHVARWGPAVSAAVVRVHRVRDALMNKGEAPGIDWFTALAMLEALDSALWFGQAETAIQLEPHQVTTMAQTIIDELETLAQELASVKNG